MKKKSRKKRAVELEARKRESTLKFHDGFLSRYRPERENGGKIPKLRGERGGKKGVRKV